MVAFHTHRETLARGDDHGFCQVNQELLRHYEAPQAPSHRRIAHELSQLTGEATLSLKSLQWSDLTVDS